MKAISLWQPWASAIPLLLKRVETRGWPTKYRGPLAIHASKKWGLKQRFFAASEFAVGRLNQKIPLGAFVAVVDVVDCRPTEEIAPQVSAIERLYGDYAPGRFAWMLANVRPLPTPIPYKGRQGFFNVPDELFRTGAS